MNGLSLCSGIGLLDLAFERAGGTVVMQCEIDHWCRQVLTKHWPNVPKHNDMKTLEYTHDKPIDIIFGGIPCQPFSQSGSKHGKSDDRHLWPYTYALVKKYRPSWVLIENVPSFIEVVFDELAADLETLRYQTTAVVLPACAIGAPHVRERACIIARLEYPTSTGWATGKPITVKHQSVWQSCKGSFDNGVQGTNTFTVLANTDSTRRGTRCTTEHQNRSARDATGHPHNTQSNGQHVRLSQSGMGRAAYGDAERLDGSIQFPAYRNEPQYEWEAPRTVEKRVPDHSRRLKSIGNGVVVPLWEQIFRFIIEVDKTYEKKNHYQS